MRLLEVLINAIRDVANKLIENPVTTILIIVVFWVSYNYITVDMLDSWVRLALSKVDKIRLSL